MRRGSASTLDESPRRSRDNIRNDRLFQRRTFGVIRIAAMEALSATAAILQILDITIRTLDVVSKFKDAPKTIRNLTIQATQLCQIVQALQANPALDPSSTPLADVLRSCLDDVREIRALLDKLASNPHDGTVEKSWKSIMRLVKEKDIGAMCATIEGHKSTLSLCLESNNVSVASISIRYTGILT